jgi:hypothetical protein
VSALDTPMISEAEARERITRVKASVDTVRDDVMSLWRGRAWGALGYAHWSELCEAEFGCLVLPREQRREVVADLSREGMSTRAIGAALGVSDETARRDRGATFVAPAEPDAEPARVTGIDGKSYPAKLTTTTRTSEATKVEHLVDTETGEIVDDYGPSVGEVIAQANADNARNPGLLGQKAVERFHLAVKTIEAAGGVDAIHADTAKDRFQDPALWLGTLETVHQLTGEWISCIRRHNLRSVK